LSHPVSSSPWPGDIAPCSLSGVVRRVTFVLQTPGGAAASYLPGDQFL